MKNQSKNEGENNESLGLPQKIRIWTHAPRITTSVLLIATITTGVYVCIHDQKIPDAFDRLEAAALEGMNEILKPGHCNAVPGRTVHEALALTAPDRTALLVDFLSDVLTLSHAKGTVFCDLDFNELSERGLRARLHGVPTASFMKDIKAVTYHEAEVRQNAQGDCVCVIVFDV